MKLREWLEKTRTVSTTGPNGAVTVPLPHPRDTQLWRLEDYQVSSVIAGTVWLFKNPSTMEQVRGIENHRFAAHDNAMASIKPGRIEEIIPQLIRVFMDTRDCEDAQEIAAYDDRAFAEALCRIKPSGIVVGNWAYRATEEQEIAWNYDFFFHEGRYYDALTPNGVEDWRKLEVVEEWIEWERNHIETEDFKLSSRGVNYFFFSKEGA